MGDRDIHSDSDDFAVIMRNISKTTRHPRHKAIDRNFYYDVAVWEVEPFDFNPFVRPICLPDRPSAFVDRYSGHFLTLTGENSKK